jgi:hypothetical protein
VPDQSASGNEPLPGRSTPPHSLRIAAGLMFAGAGLSLIGFVIGLRWGGSVNSAIHQEAMNLTSAKGTKPTASQLHTADVVGVAMLIVTGAGGVGLWVWMAWANLAGKQWARIVATILFALNSGSMLMSFLGLALTATRVVGLLGWLSGLGAVVMLWREESTDFIGGSLSGVSTTSAADAVMARAITTSAKVAIGLDRHG